MSIGIDVNQEVFKLKDSRVDKLRSGRLSAEMFANLIGPGDPFVLVDHVIYAMSEQEFYASRAVMPVNRMSEEGFHHVLDLEDKSFMHRMDREFLDKVKAELPTCPACRYKRYKDEVYKLAKKYNIKVSGKVPGEVAELEADRVVYPETTAPVVPLVSLLLQHMYRTDMPARKSCIDCVEKHIAQAWVLANETVCGYPEHLAFVIGHLGEALDEMPVEYAPLKRTLEFCLAMTKLKKLPFVPVHLLLPLINLARSVLDQNMDEQADDVSGNRTEDMEIEFTGTHRDELVILPAEILSRIYEPLSKADACAKSADAQDRRVAWEGYMGCAADVCAQLCPATANMLRNRRLLFLGNLALTAGGDWSLAPVLGYLDECLARLR